MRWVIRETLLVQLAPIEAVHEKLESSFQGFRAARKATRATRQSRQIMAQLGVIPFDQIGVRFALGNFIDAPVIPQATVGIQGAASAALGFGCFIHHLLDHFLGSLPDHFEAQIAAGQAVYDGDNVDWVFFSPMKVNSSSISASLTWLGTGGSGSWSACACIHRETVR